jgi:hypothetical protein
MKTLLVAEQFQREIAEQPSPTHTGHDDRNNIGGMERLRRNGPFSNLRGILRRHIGHSEVTRLVSRPG